IINLIELTPFTAERLNFCSPMRKLWGFSKENKTSSRGVKSLSKIIPRTSFVLVRKTLKMVCL
ncbi:MAG: hypothetical protein U9N34_06215, partial [Candidatus Cloacimonadota bacterium]|nr:hypothetical protein [Candidatus Cloacimonadota bacterium]